MNVILEQRTLKSSIEYLLDRLDSGDIDKDMFIMMVRTRISLEKSPRSYEEVYSEVDNFYKE